MVLGDVGTAVQLSLPTITKVVKSEAEAPKSTPPLPSSLEDRVRAAKVARDQIKAAHDRIKAEYDSMKVKNQPAPWPPQPLPPIKDGLAYVTYMQSLFSTLLAEIEREFAQVKADSDNLDLTKGNEGKEKTKKNKRLNDLQKQKEAVTPIRDKFAAELKREPFGDTTVVWTNLSYFPSLAKLKEPSSKFHYAWKQVFTKEYIEKIRPFLEWNLDGKEDLDQALKRLEAQKPLAKPVEGKGLPPPEKPQKDILSLGPFSIDLKAADGTAIRLVNFIDGPSISTAEPVSHPK